MEKKEVKRDYPFADSELSNIAGEKLQHMQRDATEFANYDIDDPKLADFENAITAFQNLPTDIELEGAVTEQTELKVESEESLKTKIRDIMVRVGMKFKPTQSKYKRFGTIGMNEMVDSKLQDCGLRVARVGTKLLGEIGNGLTAAMLTAVNTNAIDYQNLRWKQNDAIADRDEATEDRIEAGNELYATLMSYCSVGQSIWVTTDEAKHNDYIVHHTSDVTPPVTPPTT